MTDISLPLDEMTTAEKLGLMELLWENLSRNEQYVPSPAWHAPILEERYAGLHAGEMHITDWQEAKKQIRESLP